MVNPLVTVLMPVYDTLPELLDQAISSVLEQTFSDFELLLLDDGSEDLRTRAVLQSALKLDARVRVCHERHRGLTPSLNVGLRLARGGFIARHDADDWSDPLRLESQISYLRSNPNIVVLGTAAWMHQQGGRRLWRVDLPLTPSHIAASIWTRNPFVHGSVMFRTDDALRLGGYREELRCSQDYDFFWRLSEGGRGANLPEPLYHYRFTPGSVSASRAIEQALAHSAARLLAAARQRGEPEDVHEALQIAQSAPATGSSFRASLKQADHLMLAGEYARALHAYLRLLRSHPVSPVAWGKLLRLGVFQALPAARRACFR
jgi:glycosyltransferase involved in cell wall biosynthesis